MHPSREVGRFETDNLSSRPGDFGRYPAMARHPASRHLDSICGIHAADHMSREREQKHILTVDEIQRAQDHCPQSGTLPRE